MGSLLAIPASIDLTKLGLSPQGLTIAHAAQDYGVYVVDTGGGGFTFLAELGDPEIRWNATATAPPWWADVQIILNNLQQVTNNSASNPGGGGTRLAQRSLRVLQISRVKMEILLGAYSAPRSPQSCEHSVRLRDS